MSKPNAATSQDGQTETGEAAQQSATSAYQAPYYPAEECRIPEEYLVAFQPGYILADHVAFLGFEFEVTRLDNGYFATLDDQVFNAVRRDPGVREIEDDGYGEEDGDPVGKEEKDPAGEGAAITSKPTETSVYQAPYYPVEECRLPGEYIVSFQAGYTLAKHFAFLGFEFEVSDELDNGYLAAIDDQIFNAVRYDPGVEFIEDDAYGEVESDPLNGVTPSPLYQHETSFYQAPYYDHPECRNTGVYVVSFQPGYTLAEHFAFLGFEIELINRLWNGYYAALDDQVFNAVRYDPGVKAIEDDVVGEAD